MSSQFLYPGTAQDYLLARPATQTVGVELVGMKHMDSTFDAEMMQLTGDLESQEVILIEQQKRSLWERMEKLMYWCHSC